MVLNTIAQVDGVTFIRRLSLSVFTRLAGRFGDELCVTAPEAFATDTKWDLVADVGRRVTSGGAAFVSYTY